MAMDRTRSNVFITSSPNGHLRAYGLIDSQVAPRLSQTAFAGWVESFLSKLYCLFKPEPDMMHFPLGDSASVETWPE